MEKPACVPPDGLSEHPLSEYACVYQEDAEGIRVCVPASWTPGQILEFADRIYATVSMKGWEFIEKDPTPCPADEGHRHFRLRPTNGN